MAKIKTAYNENTGPSVFVDWLAHRINPEGTITHMKIGQRAGISPTNLTRWSRNEFAPSFEVIRRICDTLALPILPAIVKAGLVSEIEVDANVFKPDLAEATLDELFDEIQRRVNAAAGDY